MHRGLKDVIGPVSLGGMKSGFKFGANIWNNWTFNSGDQTTARVQEWLDAQAEVSFERLHLIRNDSRWFEILSQAAAGGDPSSAFSELFQNSNQAWIDYIGPDIDTAPIVTLAEDVSSWEVGDQIVVGATNYDSRETETFTLVDCPECTANQVKVDRPPSYTHWGRKGQLKLFLQNL